ncbi:MAG: hypothetical protein JXQ73_31370 [Phycisphaerae bacterium]|nr:hypothetical protein [Phycisphaerae bacterium]
MIGLVADSGRMIRGYSYDVYGRQREIVTHLDLLVDIRNNLHKAVTSENARCDVNGDDEIDLLDLLGARIPPELPTVQPYASQGRRLTVFKDAATGARFQLYDFRARAYDPILGRFMQRDPAEYADTYNLYLAFLCDPLTQCDPSGKATPYLQLLGGVAGSVHLRMQMLPMTVMGSGYAAYALRNVAARMRFLNYLGEMAYRMGLQRGTDFLLRAEKVIRGVGPYADNYRKAYEWLYYGRVGVLRATTHIHHFFNKGGQLGEWFKGRGLNPNSEFFLCEWEGSIHLASHPGINRAWMDFMTRFPYATVAQILDKGREIATNYGLKVWF